MQRAAHATQATQATHDAIDTVWRLEAAKVIGAVARLTHDVGVAKDLARNDAARQTEARVPFELPPREQLGERLAAVLQVIHRVFNEGDAATSGADWLRPALCDEALAQRQRAADLTRNARERKLLLARAHNTPPEGGKS